MSDDEKGPGDTGWQRPDVSIQGGVPTGTILPSTGIESKPCFMCRSFDKDNKKLMRHLDSKGLKADENGLYETPIARDFHGRRSMKIDPRNFGYCRRNDYVTDMRATCPDFDLTANRSDLQLKVK